MDEILRVNNLKVYYYSQKKVVPAVDGVSFALKKGEILGIVGESGCGKSTVVRGIIGLIDERYTRIEDGEVLMGGKNLVDLSQKELCRIRGKKISMIFQNPLSSLNPVYTIGSQIEEAILAHEKISKEKVHERVMELLKLVHIPAPELRYHDFPHQMSGGMQQRVLIAIALACNPEVIIADEPTTALDVTIQAQILELLRELNEKTGVGVIFITHNMGVVAEMCEEMMVMYGGVVVEKGKCDDIFATPLHPYTQGLLAAIPSIKEDKEELYSIKGHVPVFKHPVQQCRFASRCEYCEDRCRQSEPPLSNVDGREVRCFRIGEIGERGPNRG